MKEFRQARSNRSQPAPRIFEMNGGLFILRLNQISIIMEPLALFYILKFNQLPKKIFLVIETIEMKDKILMNWAYFFQDLKNSDKIKVGRSSHNNHLFNSINEEWENVVIENLKYEVFKDFIASHQSVYDEKINTYEFKMIDYANFDPAGFGIKTYNKLMDHFKDKILKKRFEDLKSIPAK